MRDSKESSDGREDRGVIVLDVLARLSGETVFEWFMLQPENPAMMP